VLALSPGFLTPEDFVDRVLRKLEEGQLEGQPYTGVLLDGLHNTFMQFPVLQDNPMVWPALYDLLIRYELTIVTTFTTFSDTSPTIIGPRSPNSRYTQEEIEARLALTKRRLHDARRNMSNEDAEIVLKGQAPFLQSLVRGIDFYLHVEPGMDQPRDRSFYITVSSAMGQALPERGIRWDGNTHRFGQFVDIVTSLDQAEQLPLPL
jgi:hypothetical protein